MKILLLEDVRGSGKKNQIVEVNDGYGRFLIKKNSAKVADKVVINEKKAQIESEKRNLMLRKEDAEKKQKMLKGKTFVIHANVGLNGKMFGAVTSKEIAEQVTKEGIELDKRSIVLKQNIKTAGKFPIEAKLFSGIIARFFVLVE